MNIFDRKGLKETAAARLGEASYNPRLLVLLHTGISLGAALLVAIANFILSEKISATGGLSGIGLRSVLTTAQSFLQLTLTLLTPFWEIGIIYAAIRLIRGQSAQPGDLTAGFYRFGPVFRLKLLQLVLLGILAMPCLYVSLGIFSMTPLSAEFINVMLPIWEEASATGQIAQPDASTIEALTIATKPLIPIFILVYIGAALPLSYRFRLADYIITDEPPCGAFAAMLTSWKMTRGRGVALFRLDLSFWWFYVLQALSAVLAYCDLLLPRLGISLPLPENGAYFLFYGLYIAAELALSWCFGAQVQTTYAAAYEAFLQPPVLPMQMPFPQEPEQF